MASFAGELASDAIHQGWHGLRPPRTRAPGGILLVHQVHSVADGEKETPLPLVFTLFRQSCDTSFSKWFFFVFSKQFTAYVETQ